MTQVATRPIGATDLRVSELGFGAAVIGNLYQAVADTEADATLAAALDHGLRYVDTAPYYGFGLSERRVGNAIRHRPGVLLSTKVGRMLRPDAGVADDTERHGFRSPMPFTPVYDYSYGAILRSHEDSLQRLGLSRIDILYVHDIGARTHGTDDARHFDALTRGGGLRALEELRSSGTIAAFGIGVNEIEVCERVMNHATLDVILLAGRYTLLEQGALATLFPRCARSSTSIVIGGPYNSGILATGTRDGIPLYDYGVAPADILARVAAIELVCEAFDVLLPAAALHFPLAHPIVASVIPGLGTSEFVDRTIALYRAPPPAEFWAELSRQGLIDERAPTPGTAVS